MSPLRGLISFLYFTQGSLAAFAATYTLGLQKPPLRGFGRVIIVLIQGQWASPLPLLRSLRNAQVFLRLGFEHTDR